MSLHVIVGAGPVGASAATQLAERGEQVRIVTRRGTGPEHPAIERIAADASDATRLTELSQGATAIYNCVNPPYDRWLTDWPPIAAAFLTAAERSGAVLAITGNLYGYGPVSAPITEHTPLAARHPKLRMRADMWREALEWQRAGRIRGVTEVRGSDYIEANGILAFALAKPLLAGQRAWVPAPLNVKHTWTSTVDVARTLIAAAGDERGWGQAWLVPSTEPLTIRELADRFATAYRAPAPKLTAVPYPAMWTVGLFSSMVRELRTTRYQFTHPFVIDASTTERTFGIKPTPLDTALESVTIPQ